MSLKSVHLHCIITLQKINRWPPYKSLESHRSASIRWRRKDGDKYLESTTLINGDVHPSNLGEGVGDGTIGFPPSSSFMLDVTLSRKMSLNPGENETFEENSIVFNLYGKNGTGKILGTAVIDLAKLYCNYEESNDISVDMTMNNDGVMSSGPKPQLYVEVEITNHYDHMYKWSIEDPADFWSNIASKFHWKSKWKQVFSGNLDVTNTGNQNKIDWFKGGITNICYNCLDRNIDSGNGDKTALYWEGNKHGVGDSLTYKQLLERVCKIANFLKEKKVKKGDTVIIYLPMIMELPITMLACARIGAVHSVVVPKSSAESLLRTQFKDFKPPPKIVVTCNAFMRGETTINLKETVDRAVLLSPISVDCLIYDLESDMTKPEATRTDIWSQVELLKCSTTCDVEWVDADDRLFILYTSRSTGNPKGVVHTTGGYMIYTATTFKYAFRYKASDVYWCTADCGWITGLSYVTYGPLLNGAIVVLYDGTMNYPEVGRCWKIIDKYKVTLFYTASTTVKSMMGGGEECRSRDSHKSLRVIGSVGKPIDKEAWSWFFNLVRDTRCLIFDIWWQIETGVFMITQKHGPAPKKPDSISFPFFGIKPVMVDKEGREIDRDYCSGFICIKKSWPGLFMTFYGDHKTDAATHFKRFSGYYFSGDSCIRCQKVDEHSHNDYIGNQANRG